MLQLEAGTLVVVLFLVFPKHCLRNYFSLETESLPAIAADCWTFGIVAPDDNIRIITIIHDKLQSKFQFQESGLKTQN